MQAVTNRMMFKLPDFMATNERKSDSSFRRPLQLHTSKSFTRADPEPKPLTRNQRASTIHNVIPEATVIGSRSTIDNQISQRTTDAFERSSDEDGEAAAASEEAGKQSEKMEELPIELASLSDSFIDSLSAKVHPTPPTVDKLAILFQDFYAVAATHINTHIAAISSRQHRANSPAPSMSSLSSTASKIRAKAVSISSKERPKIPIERRESEQQMLTPQEIAERKRARKALEVKRLALEEAVERRVCEKIYERIWRHRSTQDEAQDEKLRSKTAALSVVGIGLSELGIDLGEESSEEDEQDGGTNTPSKETDVRQWLEGARKELIAMNYQKYPLGKLQHLKAAHKSIVDTLQNFHPSSSADEIMPMLIYTLITSRPEGIDVISNLYFIQRFRNESKIDGEAAYCLTNLEAAVTFLETVDLASLRADETLSGPVNSKSIPNTPRAERFDPLTSPITPSFGVVPAQVNTTSASSTMSKSAVSPSTLLRPSMKDNSRRLSDIFQPPAAFGAAGDAVLNTADQGLKNIGDSLGNSYKFLLGKLKERQEESNGDKEGVAVPRTLEDARKLVSTPPPEDEEPASGASSLHSPETGRKRADSGAKQDDKVLSLIGGRKPTRDRSVDSSRSAGSNKKVSFHGNNTEKAHSPLHQPPPPGLTEAPAPPPANPAIVESMRNLGNSLNPMSRIAGMGMMRGFGRSSPLPSPTISKPIPDLGVAELSTTFPDLAPSTSQKDVSKIAPPIQKFMELQNPGDMKISEVLELLRDYRRLAGALKEMGAV